MGMTFIMRINSRKYSNLLIRVGYFLILSIFLISCNSDDEYCQSLEKIASDPNKASYLIRWAKSNVIERQYNLKEVSIGGGMWPGRYWVHTKFDWSILGFEAESQVRLVGDITTDSDGFLKEIESVYFGERSRKGILIKLPKSDNFGVNTNFLTKVAKNIAVVCRPYD